MSDEFDFCGEKIAEAIVEVYALFSSMKEGPFQAGGELALEEVWFRLTGKHLDRSLIVPSEGPVSDGTD